MRTHFVGLSTVTIPSVAISDNISNEEVRGGELERPRRGTVGATSSHDPSAVGGKGDQGTMVTRT